MSTHPSSSDPQRAWSIRTVFNTVIVRRAVWPRVGPDEAGIGHDTRLQGIIG